MKEQIIRITEEADGKRRMDTFTYNVPDQASQSFRLGIRDAALSMGIMNPLVWEFGEEYELSS